jgi:hypothetical protein
MLPEASVGNGMGTELSGVCIDLERTTAELEELRRQHKDYGGSATTDIEILRQQLQD